MSKKTRNRARIDMLNYILNFCTLKYFGEKKDGYDHIVCNVEHALRGGISIDEERPPIGCLVVLSSAAFSKWYLSWLKEYKDEGYGGSWLLESVEDGSLCWWTNVSIYYFPAEMTNRFPQWKWDDKQWAFWDRWNRACYKKRDAYITLPCPPKFTEDGGVILSTRTRFGFDQNNLEKRFDNWKRITQREMLEFYDSVVAEREKSTRKTSLNSSGKM